MSGKTIQSEEKRNKVIRIESNQSDKREYWKWHTEVQQRENQIKRSMEQIWWRSFHPRPTVAMDGLSFCRRFSFTSSVRMSPLLFLNAKQRLLLLVPFFSTRALRKHSLRYVFFFFFSFFEVFIRVSRTTFNTSENCSQLCLREAENWIKLFPSRKSNVKRFAASSLIIVSFDWGNAIMCWTTCSQRIWLFFAEVYFTFSFHRNVCSPFFTVLLWIYLVWSDLENPCSMVLKWVVNRK